MSKANHKKIFDFMEWIDEIYGCPDHTGSHFYEGLEIRRFGDDIILGCTHPAEDGKPANGKGQCGYHVHIDRIRYA